DFNAEAGESWYCDIEECSFLVTVQSVDNVTWNNRTYRTQYVTGYYADNLDNVVFEGRIIDGIGYEKGLFFNWGSCGIICGADYEYMRCYLEDGELLYHEGNYDCDYVPGNQPQHPQFEWYYEIENEDGSITYQYMYQAGDTIINDEPTHILVKINTLYDKGLRDEVTHEYVYERDGKVYWWNKTLEEFTVLYDYEAEVGDSWEIKVGTRTLDMHVDAVEEIEYEGRTYRMLRVSDPEDLFSGNIVCGIGHLTSFFPEKLMGDGDRMRVEGMRCYWSEGELVFKYGEEDCDTVYSEVHGVGEDGPSAGSGAFTVYPNPTNGVLFVETRLIASLPDQTYRIANLMGQTVLTGQITADNQQIDVSSLPQGMYFITVGDVTRKFVVR
ncbi:MAG: T9SS type A sorting domain-containing protein, partial [Bacteroidales bacterium]|nr:T9SS type A sorting domain-containing protein [Bacteroidales bacterium]